MMLNKIRGSIFRIFRAIGEDRGFSLVELMVVVVIIGALVAVGIPAFKDAQKTAKDNACAANIRQMNSLLALYYADGKTIFDSWDDADDTIAGYFINGEIPQCPFGDGYIITLGYIEPHAH